MVSKSIILEDLIKRDLYNKFEEIVEKIKKKINNDLSDEEKKKLIKKITCIIMLFQIDILYKNITNSSGIESILNLFGISHRNANIIRKMGSNSVNIASLALLIFTYLKKN
jgi:hypothetical protein